MFSSSIKSLKICIKCQIATLTHGYVPIEQSADQLIWFKIP